MTTAEVKAVANEEIRQAGLSAYVDSSESQFLEFPDRSFIEIVVNDAAKLEDVERVILRIRQRSDQQVDAVVRARWDVEKIGDPKVPYSMETGSPRTALQYPVVLRSGNGTASAWVEVTYLADLTLRENGLRDIRSVVRDFVDMQLRQGGTSYWDPIKHPVLEINEATAKFLSSRLQ